MPFPPSPTHNPWQTIDSRIAYQNSWLTVREDAVIRPDGHKGIYSVIERGPSVYVVALDEENRAWFVNVYRYPNGRWSWELPAGGCEENESLELAARRELEEEAGLTASTWEHLGEHTVWNGVATEISHTFLATGLTQTHAHGQNEEGINRTALIPLDEIVAAIKDGTLVDGQTITSLLRALLRLGKVS